MNVAWQPTDAQEVLLKACLLEGDEGAANLRSWLQSIDLQKIDPGSYRLLPLLTSRIDGVAMDAGTRALIKGVHRRTWYHNQLLLAEARQMARNMAAAGIPVMWLKGAALTVRHYRDAGARPMADLDLAVPIEHARRAVTMLVEAGWVPEPTPLTGTMTQVAATDARWRPGPRPLAGFDRGYFGVRHAHGFQRRAGMGMDLHWHLFQGQCDGDVDAPSWAAAVRTEDQVDAPLVPSDHEHLLLLLAHAARWNPASSIRWVADVVTLLRTSADLDWQGFVEVAKRRRLTLPARELLTYVDGRFGASIPADVLQRLRQHPVSPSVRRAHRRAVSRPTLLTGWAELRYLYGRHRALRRDPAPGCANGFLRFLCDTLGAERPSQLLRYIGSEAIRRLRA